MRDDRGIDTDVLELCIINLRNTVDRLFVVIGIGK